MAKNIFLDPLNDRELMSSFGVEQPLSPEELAQMSTPVVEETPVATSTAPTTKPAIRNIVAQESSALQELQSPSSLVNFKGIPEDKTQNNLSSEPPAPEKPMSRSEALIAEYNRLMNEKEGDLAKARKSDRMLKVGGALGDALATYLNAQSQMNVKAPGVQVQQGAGLGKVADMFATAPEITSDIAARREAMLKQYAELAKGERSQARLTSEEKRASDRMAQQERLAKLENEAMLKATGIRASEKGELTPYQQLMEDRYQEKATKLSDKQTKEIEGLDNVLSSLNEVENAKTGVNTGRYAAAGQAAVDLIPGLEADQDFVALRQMSGTQLFDYVKEQSGVSYSVKELKELENNMPNIKDDDNTFMTKLNTVRKIVERKRQNKLGAFEKQGKNVKEFKQEQPAKKAAAGDIVTVKGKKYRVAEDGDTLVPVGQ